MRPGLVVLVHGFGGHSGRFDHIAQLFNENQLSVIRFDMRGHGLSSGQRGHIRSYQELLDDLSFVIQYAETRFPLLPILRLRP